MVAIWYTPPSMDSAPAERLGMRYRPRLDRLAAQEATRPAQWCHSQPASALLPLEQPHFGAEVPRSLTHYARTQIADASYGSSIAAPLFENGPSPSYMR
jgi:hypothetical protein